jgi:hypothetical protein
MVLTSNVTPPVIAITRPFAIDAPVVGVTEPLAAVNMIPIWKWVSG